MTALIPCLWIAAPAALGVRLWLRDPLEHQVVGPCAFLLLCVCLGGASASLARSLMP